MDKIDKVLFIFSGLVVLLGFLVVSMELDIRNKAKLIKTYETKLIEKGHEKLILEVYFEMKKGETK